MTDRELIELAAKAGNITGVWEEHPDFFGRSTSGIYIEGVTELWNPLTDDGDALRLAHTLKLIVRIEAGGTWAILRNLEVFEITSHSEQLYGDKLLATRRAIVRIAAEIVASK